MRISFSRIYAKQVEIDIGRILFKSSVFLFGSFKTGLIIETFSLSGTLAENSIVLKKNKRQLSVVEDFFYYLIRDQIITFYFRIINLT